MTPRPPVRRRARAVHALARGRVVVLVVVAAGLVTVELAAIQAGLDGVVLGGVIAGLVALGTQGLGRRLDRR